MSLSKFPSFSTSNNNINWRLVFTVGAPIAIAAGGLCYWKYSKTVPSVDEKSPKKNNVKKEVVEIEDESKVLKDKGNKMFKLARYDAALENYTKAIEILENERNNCEKKEEFRKQEQLEQLYQNRAAVYEKLGAFDKVVQESSLALKLNPKYVKALHRRSRSYKLTGYLDEALEDITAVCILEGFQSASSVQLADDILKEVGAQEGMRLMRDRKPTAPSVHAVNSYIRGFWNCPISKYLRDFIPDEEPEGGNYKSALKCLKSGNYDKVLDLCTKEIDSDSSAEQKLDAYNLRGTLRFLYGYAEETLQDLNAVINNSHSSTEMKATALIKRASYFSLVDQVEDCEKSFEEAENVWKENVDLWHHRGQVLLTKSNFQMALECMTKAVEIQPDYGIAVATKWYIQYRLAGFVGDTDEQTRSAREFQKVLKRFPNSPDVYSLYGQILMENQAYEEAEIHFTKVLELEPKNASVVVHKAMSRFQRTLDPTEAIDMLKEALKIDERNEFIYETLGTLYLQMGNLEGASEYLTKALNLARSFQELTVLSSLKKAAEVQQKVKHSLNLTAPTFYTGGK